MSAFDLAAAMVTGLVVALAMLVVRRPRMATAELYWHGRQVRGYGVDSVFADAPITAARRRVPIVPGDLELDFEVIDFDPLPSSTPNPITAAVRQPVLPIRRGGRLWRFVRGVPVNPGRPAPRAPRR
jgi:hypothetical protein